MSPVRRWRAIGASTRGDSHRRNGAPNQDAFALVPGEDLDPIIAVADGHGGGPSFRSDIGSRIAVATTVRVVRAFTQANRDLSDAEVLERRVRDELPPRIVQGWADAVREDLADRPFMQWELDRIDPNGLKESLQELDQNPLVVYGATLLVAAVLGRFLILLQLGDGDILAVSDGPPGVQRPVPGDSRLVGNQTTSLCLPTAVADFRVRVLDLEGPAAPDVVMVTTDGYANSFVDDTAFLQAGPDILGHVREHGLDWVGEQLSGWLERASRHGSGDDITMGLLTPLRSSANGRLSLDPGAATTITTADAERVTSGGGGGRWKVPAAVACAAIVGAVAGALLFGGPSAPGGDPTSSPTATQTEGRKGTGEPVTSWMYTADGTLWELRGGSITGASVRLREADALDVIGSVYAGDRLWLLTPDSVVPVDPSAPSTSDEVMFDEPLGTIAAAADGVVVATADGRTLYMVDGTTFEPTRVRLGQASQDPGSSTASSSGTASSGTG